MQQLRNIISRYLGRIPQGSFGHNVLMMFMGTAIGQFGALLVSPLLTRIYSPEMFGVLGLFSAAIYILSVIAALSYEMALPLARTDEEAVNILGVCIIALIGTTVVSFIAVEAIACFGGSTLSLGELTPYRWLLPVGFFCTGAYHVMVYYATKLQSYNTIARTKIYQGISGPVSQVGMGLAGMGAWGLILGFIIGQSTGITLMFNRLLLLPGTLGKMSLSGIKAMAYRFRRFPIITSWSLLAEAIGGGYILLLTVPLLYSNAIAGFIFLTDRVVARPLLVISTSILQVYLGDMSKALSDDPASVRKRFIQLAKQQFLIVSVWMILVNIAAPYVFPFVFGQEWEAAVPYLQVLSLAYFTQMIMHALIHTLQIMERQGRSALWQTVRLIAVIASLAISYILGWSALQAMLLYSIVQAFCQVLLFFLMLHSIQSLQKETTHA